MILATTLAIWSGGTLLSYVWPSWIHFPGWLLGLRHSSRGIWERSRAKMYAEGRLKPAAIELVIVCVCASWPGVFFHHLIRAPRFAYRYWKFVLKGKGK